MEKKTVLFGRTSKRRAFDTMNLYVDYLSNRAINKIDIVYIDHERIRFETPHVRVWFVWPGG